VSGEHGLAKPDPALYRVLVDRHGLVPERAAYVDDRPENVVVAERLGMTGVVFTDAGSLRAALVELGLLPRPSSTRP